MTTNTGHHEKVYVITGVSSGVGAAVAEDLMSRGAHIIGIDKAEPKVKLSGFQHCDLTDPTQIDVTISAIDRKIDGLVNVAGVPGSLPVDTVFKVNFLALRRLTDGLLPCINDFGSVVNIASTAGANWRARAAMIKTLIAKSDWNDALAHFLSFGVDSITAYDLSKEAVILYSMLASSRERHRGVRVNTLSPGAVQTPILETFYKTMGSDLLGKLRTQAGGRDARPSEISGAVAFMLSSDSGWVNGTDLIIDGGAEVLMNLDELAVPAKTLSF